MYRLPGYPDTIIGDFEVVVHNDQLHLFHLLLNSTDVVGHLVSDDGLTWKHLPSAIRVGEPGEFDDDRIWTVGIFKHAGKWFMLYTAKKLSENGRVERTGLATSTDLIHWEKYKGNPVAEPDPRWYVAANTKDARIQWRDPHIFVENGVMHAIVAAGANDGPYNFSGCAGYFTSTDGYHWTVKPPAFRFNLGYDFEVPSWFKFNGRYYMVGLHGHTQRHVYRVADRLAGPWRRPARDRVFSWGNFAIRPVHWRGKTYLMNWLQHREADWVKGVPWGRVLVAPREVVAGEGDEIWFKTFSGWAKRAKAPLIKPKPTGFTKSKLGARGDWRVKSKSLTGKADSGYAFRLLPKTYDDFIAEVTVKPQGAREFGICFRSDPTADTHTAAICNPGYSEVFLVKHTANAPGPYMERWRGYTKVNGDYFSFLPGKSVRLRVLASGPYIEISVNDRLIIADVTMSRRSGHLGVFIADGTARFSDMTILPITPPCPNQF